jgi:hypothetical protein
MTKNAPPAGLPAQAFLIAYDVERGKLVGGSSHGIMLRAAALVELTLGGQLTDQDGKAHVTGRGTDDPELGAILARIEASRPRPWVHWVSKDQARDYQAFRRRLADERLITVERARVLGVIPRKKVTVPDTRAVRELIANARRAVLGGTPVDRVDPRTAALVALSAAIELNSVFSGAERREHRAKIKQFAERTGPPAAALRKTIEAQRNAA